MLCVLYPNSPILAPPISALAWYPESPKGDKAANGKLKLSSGEQRHFAIIGGKLLETGVAKNVFTGEVYNLNNVADFEGTYFGASTKISIIKSKGEAIANNSKCVVVKIRSVGHGLQLSAPAPGGVEVSFTD